MVKCHKIITGILQILSSLLVLWIVPPIKPWKSLICLFHKYLGYKSTSRSSREWIGSIELCALSSACLQAGVAPLCSLEQLYLLFQLSTTSVLSPGVRFLQAQGWLVSTKESGRMGRWRVQVGAPSWPDSVDMSVLSEFPFLSVTLVLGLLDPWRPMQTRGQRILAVKERKYSAVVLH